MIYGLFLDIWNWRFTKSRLKLLKTQPMIWNRYNLKISFLGVLYLIVRVDKSVPPEMVHQLIDNYLYQLNESLLVINLDGLLKFDASKYSENENQEFYLVKYVPAMPHFTWAYVLTSCALAYVLYRLTLFFGFIEHIFSAFDYIKEILI